LRAESDLLAVEPDLAHFLAAWSALPEAIRRAVLALVDSTDLAQT